MRIFSVGFLIAITLSTFSLFAGSQGQKIRELRQSEQMLKTQNGRMRYAIGILAGICLLNPRENIADIKYYVRTGLENIIVYSDWAFDNIVEYGSSAVNCTMTYGGIALESAKEHGSSAANFTMTYGGIALESAKEHGSSAANFTMTYSGIALESAKEYRKIASDCITTHGFSNCISAAYNTLCNKPKTDDILFKTEVEKK